MKINFLGLSAAAVMALGVSLASAEEQNPMVKTIESLKFWPNARSVATTARIPAHDQLVGSVAHILAYVEGQHNEQAVPLQPKLMTLYPTSSGAVVVRFIELPEGLGLHGPF